MLSFLFVFSLLAPLSCHLILVVMMPVADHQASESFGEDKKLILQCICTGVQFELKEDTMELRYVTFLSHGHKPEVNILHARTVASPRYSN